MKIGIIGVGNIGKTLALQLARARHDVKVANSRGPQTIGIEVLESGAKAVTVSEAVKDVDVVILSIPLNRIPGISPLLSELPRDTVVIDTSNYYPGRDSQIDAIEAGQVESLWVTEHLGRPIVKAWNSIGSDSFASCGLPAGTPDRIALSFSAERDIDRKVAAMLIEDTGFDAYDAGSLSESWRQQPGAPAYCTDLTLRELPQALERAEKARLPKRRDLAVAAIIERVGDGKTNPSREYGRNLCRALYL